MATVRHSFPDRLPRPATVRCYALEELFAEKVRAMGERGRPRDLHDIVNLYRHGGLAREPSLIRAVLMRKCETKGVAFPTLEGVLRASSFAELESEWENMLGHQLPALPPIEAYLEELESLFLWLDGRLEVETLIPAVLPGALDPEWRPPPLVSTWGGAPIESVRFAAANLLSIRLGYKGGHRVVEPYSLRRAKSGQLLLCAQRPEERQIKSYRVDRIKSVEVLRRVFRPRYPVEFTPDGSIIVRPAKRGAPGRRRSGIERAVQCPVCERVFRRKAATTKLRPHRDEDGTPCPGREGILRW